MWRLTFDHGEEELEEIGACVERRPVARVSAMLRPAKIIADNREFLCVVRNVSESGLNVRLFHELRAFENLTIEFDTGDRRNIRRVWQSEEQMGCVFLSPLDVPSFIEAKAGPHPRRQPRLQVDLEAVLFSRDLKASITVRDISQRGASIDTTHWLMIDELVRIESPVLPTLYAKVRWRRPPRYGVIFEETFSMADLAKLCFQI